MREKAVSFKGSGDLYRLIVFNIMWLMASREKRYKGNFVAHITNWLKKQISSKQDSTSIKNSRTKQVKIDYNPYTVQPVCLYKGKVEQWR